MNESESTDRLAEIRARLEAATRAPWEAPLIDLGAIPSFKAVDFFFDSSFEAYPPLGEAGPVFVANSRENADFIAHAREDVPWLIAQLEDERGKSIPALSPSRLDADELGTVTAGLDEARSWLEIIESHPRTYDFNEDGSRKRCGSCYSPDGYEACRYHEALGGLDEALDTVAAARDALIAAVRNDQQAVTRQPYIAGDEWAALNTPVRETPELREALSEFQALVEEFKPADAATNYYGRWGVVQDWLIAAVRAESESQSDIPFRAARGFVVSEELTDRELNEWLAEHLFGGTPTSDTDAGWDLPALGHFCLCGDDGYNHFNPSGTGDGMLLVLEAMRERGWIGVLKVSIDTLSYAHFSRNARHGETHHVMTEDFATESAPRSVAEAARAALEAGNV